MPENNTSKLQKTKLHLQQGFLLYNEPYKTTYDDNINNSQEGTRF